MGSPPEPGIIAADPEVAAAVRLLHRRRSWARMVATCCVAFLLAAGASSSATSQGTPPPSWFQDIVIALGALTVAGVVAALADTLRLRQKPPAIRARALPLAAHQPRGSRAHHYPPRHRVIWTIRWIGMLLILAVAVIVVPAPVDGVGYLAGAAHTVTFDPVSHETTCDTYSCQTGTDGILETGGAGVDATWPAVVPLGRPIQVREPVWRWGLGISLIDSDGIAVGAVVVGLLIDAFAVVVLIFLVRLALSWRRHRRQRSAPASVPVP
jgi:hypothetical protein